jgi:hypothetical protein
LSLRASNPLPSVPDDFGTGQPKRSLIPFIAAAVVILVIAGVIYSAASGRLQLPFVGKPTTTEKDSLYHWSMTFPKAWSTKAVVSTNITESDGAGVGVRVQGTQLDGEITAAELRQPSMQQQLNKDEGPTAQGRPDATILSGPVYGAVNGIPYAHYLVTFTDFSSGVGILLEDSDYFLFNGANLEIVTFECDAKNFSGQSAAFTKAIGTFHSDHLGPAVLPSPVPSASPATSPSPSPSVTATATP